MLKCAYSNLLELFQAGQRNWCSVVASTLSSCNLSNYWHTQTVDDEHLFLKSLKDQLYSNYMKKAETTLRSLGDDKTLRTYKMFKTEFRMESYLLSIPSVTYIQCIARFRLSSHKLDIELGRHIKPKLDVHNRTCNRCTFGVVDDEMHFLMTCPVFALDRNVLFSKVSVHLPGFTTLDIQNQFISIMSSKCPQIIFYLGTFLYKCLPK